MVTRPSVRVTISRAKHDNGTNPEKISTRIYNIEVEQKQILSMKENCFRQMIVCQLLMTKKHPDSS